MSYLTYIDNSSAKKLESVVYEEWTSLHNNYEL